MKLSVCIPVYNVAPYIEQCARSLFEQTYADIEYIFVDDCSPDNSIAIVERVLKDYPNRADQVKILRHDRNRGLIAARKTALKAATGALLAHCDSDDWMDPDFYARLIECLIARDADMTIGSLTGEYADGRRSRRMVDSREMSGSEALIAYGKIPGLSAMWNKVFRRTVLEKADIVWPEDIHIGEDVCHMMQLIARCSRVVMVPEAVYHYRIHGVSMTNSTSADRIVADHAAVFEVLSKSLPRPAGDPCLRHLVRTILYWGLAHRGFSCRQFRQWRNIYRQLGGNYMFDDRCRTGQRVMALAQLSPELARFMAFLKRSHILDVL